MKPDHFRVETQGKNIRMPPLLPNQILSKEEAMTLALNLIEKADHNLWETIRELVTEE